MRPRLLPTLASLVVLAFALSFWHGVLFTFGSGTGLDSATVFNGSVGVALVGPGGGRGPVVRALLWDPPAPWWRSLLSFGAEQGGPGDTWRVRFWFPLIVPAVALVVLAVRSHRRRTTAAGTAFEPELKDGA